jgi:predicted methyltransferase
MIPLTDVAQQLVRRTLQPGDIAIDATAGNGHDTRFLASVVGATGMVYGFDIQPQALERTAQALRDADFSGVQLVLRDHAEMLRAIPGDLHGRISAVMFNLGYLPGGNKALTTRVESTVTAIRSSLTLLRPGGIITIIAYPGHPGGDDETAAVEAELLGLERTSYDWDEPSPAVGRVAAPRLFVVRNRAPMPVEPTRHQ